MKFKNVPISITKVFECFKTYVAESNKLENGVYTLYSEPSTENKVKFNVSYICANGEDNESIMSVVLNQDKDTMYGSIDQIIGNDFLGGSAVDLIAGMEWDHPENFDTSILSQIEYN